MPTNAFIEQVAAARRQHVLRMIDTLRGELEMPSTADAGDDLDTLWAFAQKLIAAGAVVGVTLVAPEGGAAAHGFPTPCPDCNGTGTVRFVDAFGSEAQEMCSCGEP